MIVYYYSANAMQKRTIKKTILYFFLRRRRWDMCFHRKITFVLVAFANWWQTVPKQNIFPLKYVCPRVFACLCATSLKHYNFCQCFVCTWSLKRASIHKWFWSKWKENSFTKRQSDHLFWFSRKRIGKSHLDVVAFYPCDECAALLFWTINKIKLN